MLRVALSNIEGRHDVSITVAPSALFTKHTKLTKPHKEKLL